MIKPQYTFSKVKDSAARQFTDREEPRSEFINAFCSKVKDEYKVLTYYGIGGIGKSRLLNELSKILEAKDKEAVYNIIDFKNQNLRSCSDALFELSKQLHNKYNVKFNNFALAYVIYWKKTNPQIPINISIDIPFVDEGEYLTDIISTLKDAPVIGWIPKGINIVYKSWNKFIKKWWTERGENILKQLCDMKPTDIENYLPACFAEDIKTFMNKKNRNIVIFFDTYEALWHDKRHYGEFHDVDSWIQELVIHLPEVLWVIFGRDKIEWNKINSNWNKILEQHLLQSLSNQDCEKFLIDCDVEEADIRTIIIEACEGVPFYLDLSVDTYREIENRSSVIPNDFAVTKYNIVGRLLENLDREEKETLKILSCTRKWNIDLFNSMVVDFSTNYPITAYQQLFRFSFIEYNDTTGAWFMHKLMRKSLQGKIYTESYKLYIRIHKYLFNYYNNMINTMNVIENIDCIIEAIYHGKIILDTKELDEWKKNIFNKFVYESKYYIPNQFIINDILYKINNKDKQDSQNYFIYGQAGSGKTTLKNYLEELCFNNGFLVASISNVKPSEESIIYRLFELTNHFMEWIDFRRFNKAIKKYISSFKAEADKEYNYCNKFSIDYYKEFFNNNKIGQMENEGFKNDLLSSWVEDINEKLSDKNIVIFIDDFETIPINWIDDITKLMVELPSVTWIFFSRDINICSGREIPIAFRRRTFFSMYKTSQIIPSEVTYGFLTSKGIASKEIIERILEKSNDNLLILNEEVKKYFSIIINEERKPSINDFS